METAETRNRAVKTGLSLRHVCETAKRRDLATSLALRDGPRRGRTPHAGKALATLDYRWAQASRRNEP